MRTIKLYLPFLLFSLMITKSLCAESLPLLQQNNDIQMMVLLKYTQVVEDIKKGEGDYLDAIEFLLKKKPTTKIQLVADLKKMLKSSSDIYRFSALIKDYEENPDLIHTIQ